MAGNPTRPRCINPTALRIHQEDLFLRTIQRSNVNPSEGWIGASDEIEKPTTIRQKSRPPMRVLRSFRVERRRESGRSARRWDTHKRTIVRIVEHDRSISIPGPAAPCLDVTNGGRQTVAGYI